MATSINTPTPTVQHLTKPSSDELLSKFSELDSPKKSPRLIKRQKRSAQSIPVTRRKNSEFTGGIVVERKSLLLPVMAVSKSSGATKFVRQLKVGRAHFRTRNFRNRSFFRAIEKTWQRTIDGASKVFIEKQYNRHKRLLSDPTYMNV